MSVYLPRDVGIIYNVDNIDNVDCRQYLQRGQYSYCDSDCMEICGGFTIHLFDCLMLTMLSLRRVVHSTFSKFDVDNVDTVDNVDNVELRLFRRRRLWTWKLQ